MSQEKAVMKVLVSLYSEDVSGLGLRKRSASIWDDGDGILCATISNDALFMYQNSFENVTYLEFFCSLYAIIPFTECFSKGFEVVSYDLQAIMEQELCLTKPRVLP